MAMTLCGLALASGLFAAPAPQDNVLVLLLDDVGPELLGCYDGWRSAQGFPSGAPAHTPAIDQLLAARGVSFLRAYTAPTCSPSRAQLLTGLRGEETGIGRSMRHRELNENPGLSPAFDTLPTALQQAAQPYTSAWIGKWHLASNAQLALDLGHPLGAPHGRWFARFAGSMFNLLSIPGVPAQSTGYFAWDKVFASEIELGVDPCAGTGLPCTVELATPPLENYATLDTADDALALVAQLPEPWFVVASFHAAHGPLHEAPPGLPTAACDGYVAPAPTPPGPSPTPAQLTRHMLESLDAQLGRLLCALDHDDTTVVLMGDNGTARSSVTAPYVQGHAKRSVYEGGINVPLIVRSRWIPPANRDRRCEALVSSTDLFATICDLASVDPTPITGASSVSLVPYLFDAAALSQRPTVYAEFFQPNFTPDPLLGSPPPGYVGMRHDQALQDARFKLVRKTRRDGAGGPVRKSDELYDRFAGGPPDAFGTPTADLLEKYDLLAPSAPPLGPEAALALNTLRAELDLVHPSLVR